MAEFDIAKVTTPTVITDYSIDSESPDSPADQKETTYSNPNFSRWYGNYKNVAKIKVAINAFATWVLGKGWTADAGVTAILENITGWGEDTFNSVMWNLIVTKKVNGDAYAEIIRNPETGTLINLKPLNPQFIRIVCNRKGIIIRYDELNRVKENSVLRSFQPRDILHLCNDRTADEIHGTSVIEAVEWNVEATEEAKRAHRKMVKRNGVVRVIEVDTDNTAKRDALKKEWKTAIENGDVLILPKGTAEAKDFSGNLDTVGVIAWLKYNDDDFYMSIGIPRVILGGSAEFTEASSKISYLTYEQVYTRETTEMEADLWNQVALRITFNKPASIKNELLSSEEKNTGQTSFQPKDTEITVVSNNPSKPLYIANSSKAVMDNIPVITIDLSILCFVIILCPLLSLCPWAGS